MVDLALTFSPILHQTSLHFSIYSCKTRLSYLLNQPTDFQLLLSFVHLFFLLGEFQLKLHLLLVFPLLLECVCVGDFPLFLLLLSFLRCHQLHHQIIRKPRVQTNEALQATQHDMQGQSHSEGSSGRAQLFINSAKKKKCSLLKCVTLQQRQKNQQRHTEKLFQTSRCSCNHTTLNPGSGKYLAKCRQLSFIPIKPAKCYGGRGRCKQVTFTTMFWRSPSIVSILETSDQRATTQHSKRKYKGTV